MEQKTKLTLGGLFEGIGGFPLAATWAGIEPVWSNEIDKYACKVLRKNFNHEIIEKDIREIGKHNLPGVDIISGGFPCQPFSNAGKRKGTADNRYLWPEMLRVIRELKPSFVIGENVAGLLSMENGETLKGILSDLENEGYNNEVFIIPACGVQAWHRRDRIWIVCHSNGSGYNRTEKPQIYSAKNQERITDNFSNAGIRDTIRYVSDTNSSGHIHGGSKEQSTKGGIDALSKSKSSGEDGENVSNTTSPGLEGWPGPDGQKGKGRLKTSDDNIQTGQYWTTEPNVGRVANGIPHRVDRLKGLGNAIVPQVAYEIFKAINQVDMFED